MLGLGKNAKNRVRSLSSKGAFNNSATGLTQLGQRGRLQSRSPRKQPFAVKYLKNTLLIVLLLYSLYLIKSELGINISQRYHAWDVLKLPLKVLPPI